MNKNREDELRHAIKLLMPGLDTTKLYSVFCDESCCQPRKDALQLVCDFLNEGQNEAPSNHFAAKPSAPLSRFARLYFRWFPLQGQSMPADGSWSTTEIKPRRFLGWIVR